MEKIDKMEIMPKLTNRQIARQDFVDNQIFELIQGLIPAPKKVKWDIEMIGEVRESIRKWVVEELKISDEMRFYPYLKI